MSVLDRQTLLSAPASEKLTPEERRELNAAVFQLEQTVHTLHQNAADNDASKDKDNKADLKIWKAVQNDAIGLLEGALDLRVAVLLTNALLHRKGYAGFNEGLLLILGMLETHWEDLIPEEDESDAQDPFLERVNLLENLCEWQTTIKPLLAAQICASRETGRFCLRDVCIATGKRMEMFVLTEAEKTQPPQLNLIQATCKKMDVEELTELQTITNSLKESLTAIEAILTERVGPDKTPDFGTLMEIITEADDFYAHQLSLKQPVGMLSGLKQSLSGKKRRKTPPTSEETAIKARETPMESINSRQDVIRLLDQICVFYAQNEPASPVPLLLQRARTLVEKNFYEIMEDLAPKTATELKKLIGEPGNE